MNKQCEPHRNFRIPRRLIIILGTVAIIWVSWTQIFYPTYEARYKLTIEVETPEGIKNGSSVIAARFGWEPTLFGLISGIRNSVSGEAVYVDLGDNKNLFVSLVADGMSRPNSLNALALPLRVFPIPAYDRWQTREDIKNATTKGEVQVPITNLPLTVTFGALNDPQSARRVEPDDLSTIIGAGYKITSAKIEITAEPLSAQIQDVLPWLGKPNENLKCKSLTAMTFQIVCRSILKKQEGKL